MYDKIKTLINNNMDKVSAYAALVGGAAGRLVVSLVYFVAIANTLAVEDFGLFATASATGIVISRFFAFGFTSPLYRIATAKRRLLGVYTSGMIVGGILSLPIMALAAYLVFLMLFEDQMTALAFACIVFAEILFWRSMEIVAIILNGVYKFGVASILVIIATMMKMFAAFGFAFFSTALLEDWAVYYIIANATSALLAVAFFYPSVRLRWRPSLYLARWVDSLAVASAEFVYFAQSELDKIVVLAIGGPQIAGLYAILIRLVDLTALPVRSLLTLVIQQILCKKSTIQSMKNRFLIEGTIVIISFTGIMAMAIFIMLFPNVLGEQVSQIAPYLFILALVPCFRNLIEYHSELLYAINRTLLRTSNAALIGVMKVGLLTWILKTFNTGIEGDDGSWLIMINVMFGMLYVTSILLTYPAMRKVAPIIKKQSA